MKERLIVSCMLLALLALMAALMFGCASAPGRRGEVELTIKPNRLVIGPAHGHLSSEADQPLTTYVVRGVDCSDFNAVASPYVQMIHGEFQLGESESLCVSGRPGDRVLFHAVH